jgi:hypothetical protein
VTFSIYADWNSGVPTLAIVHLAGCPHERRREAPPAPDMKGLHGVLYGPFATYDSVYDYMNDPTEPLDLWAPAECLACKPGAVAAAT